MTPTTTNDAQVLFDVIEAVLPFDQETQRRILNKARWHYFPITENPTPP